MRRIVLDERELRPAHWFRGPGGNSVGGWDDLSEEAGRDVSKGGASAGDCCGLQELTTRKRGLAHARYGT